MLEPRKCLELHVLQGEHSDDHSWQQWVGVSRISLLPSNVHPDFWSQDPEILWIPNSFCHMFWTASSTKEMCFHTVLFLKEPLSISLIFSEISFDRSTHLKVSLSSPQWKRQRLNFKVVRESRLSFTNHTLVLDLSGIK